jgi:hypothetical protein
MLDVKETHGYLLDIPSELRQISVSTCRPPAHGSENGTVS